MVAKMTDELEIAYMSFCPSYTVIMNCIRKKCRGGKLGLGNGCWSGTKEELIMEF